MRKDSQASSDQNKQDTKELAREIHWVEKTTMWVQIGLGLIGLGALWIYHGQLTAMQGQLDQMSKQFPEIKKSAEAAKKAADASETSNTNAENFFEVSERAYLGDRGLTVIQNPSSERQAVVKVSILNGGHSPALNVESSAFFALSNRELNQFIEPENKSGSKSTLLPTAELWTNPIATDSSIESKGHIDAAIFNGLQHRTYFLYLFGVVEYGDIFGKRWKSRFCYFYVPDQSTNEGIFSNCKFGNSIGLTANR